MGLIANFISGYYPLDRDEPVASKKKTPAGGGAGGDGGVERVPILAEPPYPHVVQEAQRCLPLAAVLAGRDSGRVRKLDMRKEQTKGVLLCFTCVS